MPCNMLFSARITSNHLGARRLPLACKLHVGTRRAHHGPHLIRADFLATLCNSRPVFKHGTRALHSPATAFNETTGPTPFAKTNNADTKPKEEIRLTGAEEMLLPVVFLKAEDAKSEKPILGDPFSQHLLDACAIDYSKTHFTRDYRYIKWVTNRAKQFDNWCQVC